MAVSGSCFLSLLLPTSSVPQCLRSQVRLLSLVCRALLPASSSPTAPYHPSHRSLISLTLPALGTSRRASPPSKRAFTGGWSQTDPSSNLVFFTY